MNLHLAAGYRNDETEFLMRELSALGPEQMFERAKDYVCLIHHVGEDPNLS